MTRGRVLLLLLLTGPFILGTRDPAVSAATSKRALILYDGTSIGHLEGRIDAEHVANLMGHFGFAETRVAVEDYRRGDIGRYDVVFVTAGAEAAPLPEPLIQDARAASTPLVWMGFQLGRLVPPEDVDRRGFRFDGYLQESEYRHVRYKQTVLGKGSGDLAGIAITDPARVTVAAAAIDPEGRELPYIVHAGNLWVVADVPFAYVDEQDRYLAFCDVLHDILNVPHHEDRRALIRLEDITPEDDPADVRRAIAAFVAEGVPFQVGIVPIFRDPANNREVTLSDRPALVAALLDGVRQGGTIVLHGDTHQYRGVSPDDFEFWDAERNAPRGDDSVELVRNKLAAALDECFRNGLYPVAWETPHYTASHLDYSEVAKVFSTFYERMLTMDRQGTQQFFPFPTIDVRGAQVVPENLGYLPAAKPDAAVLVANAKALLVVRDGIASGYVHDFLDPAPFHEVIRGVKALGYRFVSLRDFPARVSDGSHLILTTGATGSLRLQDEYLHEFLEARDGRRTRESTSTVRRSGIVTTALVPGDGEIVVAEGIAEPPPAPPGALARLQAFVARTWLRVRRHSPLPPSPPVPLLVALVWDPSATGEAAMDQESFRRTFVAYGVTPRELKHSDLAGAPLSPSEVLVVPVATARALSREETAAVIQFVKAGGGVITDGRSALTEGLGIAYTGRPMTAGNVRDMAAPETILRWRPLATVEGFRLPASAVPLASDTGNGTPVSASFAYGSGRVLYLATSFDPFTRDGTSRYPFLFEHVLERFGRQGLARRSGIELYFDPGLRPGVSIEQLAVAWRRQGVRVIYAAAWEFDPNYTYDYERLLRVAHANGLLVYAWFELPQVSRTFWLRHPEWREVPAKGQAYPSWRLAMNFANPACRAAAIQFMADVLGRWPWDGVNLAELNFDGIANGDDPVHSVPMNADVRAAFATERGFDPAQLFAPGSRHWWKRDRAGWAAWLGFRRSLVTEWHREFLTALRPLMDGGREVIVTVLDGLEHPAVADDAGVDPLAILGLLATFDFTLQVEDPAPAWTDSPRRYERLAERYRPLMPPNRRLMFDINVVPDRRVEATHLPLAAAAGGELLGAVKAARAAGPRVALYGDATVRGRDLELMACALADRTRVSVQGLAWTVEGPDSVEIPVPGRLHDFYVDGETWPFWRSGSVLLPPGSHVLSTYRPWLRLFDLSALSPQLLLVNATVDAAEATHGNVRFEYVSDGRALALLGRQPKQVLIDDVADSDVTELQDRGVVVLMPKGRHRVEISGSSPGGLVLDLVSVISSSLIVAFGTAAVLMLILVYGGIRLRRLGHMRGH